MKISSTHVESILLFFLLSAKTIVSESNVSDAFVPDHTLYFDSYHYEFDHHAIAGLALNDKHISITKANASSLSFIVNNDIQFDYYNNDDFDVISNQYKATNTHSSKRRLLPKSSKRRRRRKRSSPCDIKDGMYEIMIQGGVSPSNRKYLSVTRNGFKADLYTKNDKSGRQEWLVTKRNNGDYHIQISKGVIGGRKYLSVTSIGERADLWYAVMSHYMP